MKFTPTNRYKAVATGSGKLILVKAYIKVTNSLSEALSAGAWTDVSLYLVNDVDAPKMPVMWSNCEWQVGKPKFGKLELTGKPMSYWRTLFDSVGAGYMMEFKCELKIGYSASKMATDTVYAFSGWVDTLTPFAWNEREGTVNFSVISHDEIGSRISAETFVTQTIRKYLGTSSKDGLILRKINGIYVTDANVTSYVLKKGIHIFSYNVPTAKLSLDGGTEVSIPGASGYVTLTNEAGDQKMEVYVDLYAIHLETTTITQDVIVTTEGTTVPNTWYCQKPVDQLLIGLYNKIGLTSYTMDDFRFDTWDGSYRDVPMEVPPNSETYYGKPMCLCMDRTNNRMFVGQGEYLFYRTNSTNAYTNIGIIESGYLVVRILGDRIASNSELLVILINLTTHLAKLARINVSDWTYTTYSLTNRGVEEPYSYPAAGNFAYVSSLAILIYCSAVDMTKKYKFDLSTNTETLLFTGQTSDSWTAAFSDGSDYFYQKDDGSIIKLYYSGAWAESSMFPGVTFGELNGAVYNASENAAILSVMEGAINPLNRLVRIDLTAGTYVFVSTAGGMWGMDYYNGKVYGIYHASSVPYNISAAYVVSTDLVQLEDYLPMMYQYYNWNTKNGYAYDSVRDEHYYLGEDTFVLSVVSKSPPMYVFKEFDCEGKYVIDSVRDLEKQFNLIGVVSTNKTVKVYRRSDESGNMKSSGSNATVIVNYVEDIKREEKYIRGVGLVVVDNGSVNHSYDGTTFDPGLLANTSTLKVTGSFIPDNLIKDMAKYLYLFFSKNFSKYTISLANVIKWEYECFDGADITFDTTRIVKTGIGLIYGIGIDSLGSTEMEILMQD